MRLSGLAAGIATFAVLEIVNNILQYYEKIGPGQNTFSSVPETTGIWQAAVGALIAVAVAFVYQRSRFGRMLRATREDPAAASAAGISMYVQRLGAFVALRRARRLRGRALRPSAAAERGRALSRPDVRDAGDARRRRLVEPLGRRRRRARDQRAGLVPRRGRERRQDRRRVTLDLPSGTRVIVEGVLMALVLIARPSGLTGGREFALPRLRRGVSGAHDPLGLRRRRRGDRQPLRRTPRPRRRRLRPDAPRPSTPLR